MTAKAPVAQRGSEIHVDGRRFSLIERHPDSGWWALDTATRRYARIYRSKGTWKVEDSR